MAVARSIPVTTQAGVEAARRAARELAAAVGLTLIETERVTLAVSELATNLLRYAHGGQIVLTPLAEPNRSGLQVESQDRGPGIADIELALTDGYSTGGGLGDGLPAVRRLMDAFEVTSGPDGTRVVASLWTRRRS